MNILDLKSYIKDLPDDMEVIESIDGTEFPANPVVTKNKFYV